MAAKNVTIEMIAEEIEVSPRKIRKVLRANDSIKAPGKGGRWLFAESDKDKIISIIRAGHESQSVIDLSDVEIDA